MSQDIFDHVIKSYFSIAHVTINQCDYAAFRDRCIQLYRKKVKEGTYKGDFSGLIVDEALKQWNANDYEPVKPIQQAPQKVPSDVSDDEDDPDVKQAIVASLQDFTPAEIVQIKLENLCARIQSRLFEDIPGDCFDTYCKELIKVIDGGVISVEIMDDVKEAVMKQYNSKRIRDEIDRLKEFIEDMFGEGIPEPEELKDLKYMMESVAKRCGSDLETILSELQQIDCPCMSFIRKSFGMTKKYSKPKSQAFQLKPQKDCQQIPFDDSSDESEEDI